ncbi:MAG: 2Fe-2S ferredoxin [Cyclobacteriaceae bacterium]|jgi:2Fe-2S ferredoxin
MPKVIVENLHGKAIHCVAKTERLLDILVSAMDWMKTCGGQGKCTTCAAIIVEGGEKLNEPTDAEIRFSNLGRLNPNERLACQCLASSDLVIRVPDRNKLPFLDYSE